MSESGGYADTIIDDPNLFRAIEVHGVRDTQDPARVEKEGTICEVDDDNPQFYSAYAVLKVGGMECIGDFDTELEAYAYGISIAALYNWPVHNFVTHSPWESNKYERLEES